MSIRFERVPRKCTHLNKKVTLLVTWSTPKNLPPDAELVWERSAQECLERKTCGDACPGEAEVLVELAP